MKCHLNVICLLVVHVISISNVSIDMWVFFPSSQVRLQVKLCIMRVKWCAFLFYILQVFACQMSKTWSKIRIGSANPLPFLLVLEVVKPWIFMVMTHNVVTWSEAAHKQQCIASQQIPGHTVSRQHDSRNIVECRINSSNKFSKPWVKGWPHTFENAGFETEFGKAR